MTIVLMTLGGLSLLVWFYLLVFHHRFWRADQRLDTPQILPDWPPVTAIVPARNEAATIAACVKSLLVQDYPGTLSIIVVDDSSTDGTGDIARKAGKEAQHDLAVINAPPLQKGWSGKLWALHAGLEHVPGDNHFIWFTDADIAHTPDTLRSLVNKAETDDRALVSLMVKLHCASFWERLIAPAFVYFFQMLYPFPAVNNPDQKTAGAAGGCILLRHDVLKGIGGIRVIKDDLIDDCALANAVQRHGGRLWLGLTDTSRSLRAANGLGDLWRMVTRTAFTQLGYSNLLLLGTTLGLALLFLVPPAFAVVGLINGAPVIAFIGIAAWAIMAVTYWPTLRLYDQRRLAALLLPLNGLLYGAMTVHSALNHWTGQSSRWKGRIYER